MQVEPAAAFGADAAPLPNQQRAAEQIGPHLHSVEAPLIVLRPHPHQAGGFREERQLDRSRPGRGHFAGFGHGVARSVSAWPPAYKPKPPKSPDPGATSGRRCYTITGSVTAGSCCLLDGAPSC